MTGKSEHRTGYYGSVKGWIMWYVQNIKI